MDEGYGLENMDLRLSISKAYTMPLQMQSHSLGMIPVSIKQLRATLQQKSIRTQNAVRDKTGWQSHKYEDLNLVFVNHGKEDKIYPLRTKITSKRDSKCTKQRSIIKYPHKNM